MLENKVRYSRDLPHRAIALFMQKKMVESDRCKQRQENLAVREHGSERGPQN